MNRPDAKTEIDHLIWQCHQTAIDKGWWPEPTAIPNARCEGAQVYKDNDRSFAEQIALMHSELSEALEDYRNGRDYTEISYEPKIHEEELSEGVMVHSSGYKPCGIASEFADVLIRIFDTCGRYKIPLAQVLIEKMEYNKTRPIRHGGKLC